MPHLNFISDKDLESAVKAILNKAAEVMRDADQNFEKNVINPFSILFQMSGFDILTVEEWKKIEQITQINKKLTDSLGGFHPMILGSVKGWKNLGVGGVVDLECRSRKIIAEVKNKHNTVKKSNLHTIYDTLHTKVMTKGNEYRGFTGYYVEILPLTRQPYDIEFTPSDSAIGQRRQPNRLIRKIDGKSFYGLVTGDPDALEKLFDVLPEVISSLSTYKFKNMKPIKHYFDKAYE